MPILGCSPRPRNRPGGSTRKLPTCNHGAQSGEAWRAGSACEACEPSRLVRPSWRSCSAAPPCRAPPWRSSCPAQQQARAPQPTAACVAIALAPQTRLGGQQLLLLALRHVPVVDVGEVALDKLCDDFLVARLERAAEALPEVLHKHFLACVVCVLHHREEGRHLRTAARVSNRCIMLAAAARDSARASSSSGDKAIGSPS